MNISVVMPVRNGARYIAHSIQMITDNCKPQDEVIIIDDGSTDATANEIMKLRNVYNHIKLIQTEGLGIVAALNLGILEATNPLIARFDVDDLYPSSRLDSQRELLVNDTVGVFTDYKFIDHTGTKSLGVMPSAVHSYAVALSLVNSQRTAHPSSVFTKEAWEAAGRYREEDFPAEDLSLWLRMLRVGKLVSVPEVGLDYRIHDLSITSTRRNIALSRKAELIRDIGFPVNLFKDVDWMEIYESYDKLTLGPERKVLLLYDFVRMKNIMRQISLTKEIKIQSLLKWENFNALVGLQRERELRRKLRNGSKPTG